jgi:DNA-binding response OmpR family regulator
MSQLLDVDGLLDEALSPPASAPLSARSAGKPTVLIASPLATVLHTAQTALESTGYRVILAPDGYAAADQFRAHPGVGLALLADNLPHAAGLSLVRQLRQAGYAPAFVWLCRSTSWWMRFRARRAGCVAVARRQIEGREILAIARQYLPLRSIR